VLQLLLATLATLKKSEGWIQRQKEGAFPSKYIATVQKIGRSQCEFRRVSIHYCYAIDMYMWIPHWLLLFIGAMCQHSRHISQGKPCLLMHCVYCGRRVKILKRYSLLLRFGISFFGTSKSTTKVWHFLRLERDTSDQNP